MNGLVDYLPSFNDLSRKICRLFLSFAVGYRNERSREVKGLTPLDKLPGYRKITYVKREKMKALHDWGLWACLCLLGACRDGSPALGEGLVETSFYNVYVDTCTVDISTVLSDSLLTRGDSVCQVAAVGQLPDLPTAEPGRIYYTLTPVHSREIIYIPADSTIFMRPVISREAAEALLKKLETHKEETT